MNKELEFLKKKHFHWSLMNIPPLYAKIISLLYYVRLALAHWLTGLLAHWPWLNDSLFFPGLT